jgi:hypothetical protein
MNKQNLIVYPGGCYGTFFEWLFNFLENPSMPVPFRSSGSSHIFPGNLLYPKEKLSQHIASGRQHRFSRMHPGMLENNYSEEYHKILENELKFLMLHFDSMLVIGYDQESVLWQQNNGLFKTLFDDESFQEELAQYGHSKEHFKHLFVADPVARIKTQLDQEIKSELGSFNAGNLNGWHKNNINEFDVWELRELLSLYWFTRTDGEIDALEQNKLLHHNKIMFISISDIKNNFIDTVTRSAQHFDVPMADTMINRLQDVYQQWLPLQTQINKDSICRQVVESLLDNIPFDWRHCNLSIIDEAWIQKTLRDNQVEIKCQDLNEFPTNTDDFLPLLETEALLLKEKK